MAVWDSTKNKKQIIKNPTGCGGVGLCGIACGCGLVQLVADIRIIINLHTLFIGWTVYDTGKNKSSNKNYQSKTHIIQIRSGG